MQQYKTNAFGHMHFAQIGGRGSVFSPWNPWETRIENCRVQSQKSRGEARGHGGSLCTGYTAGGLTKGALSILPTTSI